MPLYTVRCRMVPLYGLTRGSQYVEMTHHLHWDDDAAALDAFPNLVQHWNDAGISSRWVVQKEDRVHELALFRRDIGNRNAWTPLARELFSVAAWLDIGSLGVVIDGAPLNMDLREAPIFPSSRGAVYVRENTENPLVRRRLYVGPISPVCAMATFSLIVSVPYTTQTVGPNLDFPFDPETDNVDLWRDEIRDMARDHCADLEGLAGDGYSVVASWKYGLVLPVLETRASSVRAELSTRGVRGAMSAPRT